MIRIHCLRAVGALALLGIALIGTAHAERAPSAPPPRFEVDALRADFDALYEGLQLAHYDLYARRDKAGYDRLFQRMRAQISAPMSLLEAEVLFQRFVAFGQIAHANIAFPAAAWERFRREGGRALPIYPHFDGERFLVGGNWAEGIPAGAELLALDGEPVDAWFRRLRAHLSADSDYMARAMMAFRWPALLWLEIGEREAFEVRWRDGQGSVHVTRVKALTQSALGERMSGRANEERPARSVELREDGIAYLRPGPFYNLDPASSDPWDARSFIAFLDDAFERIIDGEPRALLIDLRDNPGGDNSFSDPMVAWFADRPFRFASRFTVKSSEAARAANQARIKLAGERGSPMSQRYEALYAAHPPGERFEVEFPAVPPRKDARFDGPVYLLINRHTYSTAAIVAALVQDYRFARILGEETSDLATTYGAMERFTLPHTGIQVGFPKAYMVRPSGDTSARGVVPDLAIRTPPGDEAWERVLQQAVAIIHGEMKALPAGE